MHRVALIRSRETEREISLEAASVQCFQWAIGNSRESNRRLIQR